MGMRVLVTTPAGIGHVNPMVPLARALAARGHEVLWAVPGEGAGHVERVGIRALRAGPVGIAGPAEVRRLYPELNALSPAAMPDVMFGKLFGAMIAPSMLSDMVPLVLEWRPNLVVADAGEFAGHILAAELGVPSVTKGFGMLLPERRVAAAAEEVAPLWRSRGLVPRPYGGAYQHLYLDIYPPELGSDAASHVPHRHLMRPTTDDTQNDISSTPPLPDARPDAPLVYVTMGTVFNNPEPLRVVLAALNDMDVRVLVTVGPGGDPATLGTQPAHVRVERYVPQTLVLPHCAVVVSHGGSGTVLATIALGLPQLCLPQGADQFLNAAAVSSAGAGLSLTPDAATASAVRDAVSRLLGDASFGDAARRVSASIAAMPSPEDVAAMLESLA
ncbi:MAG TPA: glycosyltransferase [Candidatus Angelobacter sp.]|jgi:UDP:flavonoid glycosyltransferase YjiC (YdhE family)|nr:glycosyltransferase [Candidatus Angelobacter sp.]